MDTLYQPYTNGDASQHLLNRLNDPNTAEALNQILDRIDVVAFTVTSLDGFLARGEQIADEAARSVADLKAAAPSDLGNALESLPVLLERLPQLMEALPRLLELLDSPAFQQLLDVFSDPKTLESITALLLNIDKLAFAIDAINGFLARSESIIENVAESVKDARPGLNVDNIGELVTALPKLAEVTPTLLETTSQLAPVLASDPVQEFLTSGALQRLLSSGILAEQTISVVDQAGQALVKSYDETQEKDTQLGLFGLLRALRDPNTQKTLGFLAEFGKQFGEDI